MQAVSHELSEETSPRAAAQPSRTREFGGIKASTGSSESHLDIAPLTTVPLSTLGVLGSAAMATNYSRTAVPSHQGSLAV